MHGVFTRMMLHQLLEEAGGDRAEDHDTLLLAMLAEGASGESGSGVRSA
jgi:hypothetical protein